jgi:hypothetical protein
VEFNEQVEQARIASLRRARCCLYGSLVSLFVLAILMPVYTVAGSRSVDDAAARAGARRCRTRRGQGRGRDGRRDGGSSCRAHALTPCASRARLARETAGLLGA